MTGIIQTTKLVIDENMESENAYIRSQIKASGSAQLVISCDSGHFFLQKVLCNIKENIHL